MMVFLGIGVLGACLGSFMYVVIRRLPRRQPLGQPSHCEGCGHRLRVRDLVPIGSYLWLRGRCRYCSTRIGLAYLIAESLMAGALVGFYVRYGASLYGVQQATLFALVAMAAEIDRHHYIVPNELVGVGVLLGLLLLPGMGWEQAISQVLAACGSMAALGGLKVVSRAWLGQEGLGMGDVKLAGMMGLFLGWKTPVIWYGAMVLGGMFGLAGIAMGRLERTSKVPLVPFVAAALVVYWAVEPIFLP